MSRTRNEISKKNKYYISKHRYLELKHFCLQYPEWQKLYNEIENLQPSKSIVKVMKETLDGDFVEKAAILRCELSRQMNLVRNTANKTDEYLAPFIFQCVTTGRSYEYLRLDGMACCKDMFYDRYHKFFWLLDKSR